MVRPITGILGNVLSMLRQGISIILLACILAILANTARPLTLPLFAPPFWMHGMSASQPEVSIEEAERLFAYGKAVFIDARSPELYAASHIQGARNIPQGPEEKFPKEALKDLPKDSILIVYWGDETSAAGRSLSIELSGKDKARKVRVLLRGWDQWVANELPIEAGGSPAPRGKAG
jgi:rhodanese-related sulfurtransferase